MGARLLTRFALGHRGPFSGQFFPDPGWDPRQLVMCTNRSRLHFFDAVAAATALACGVFAGPGLAKAVPPKTDQQAAPASSVVPGGSSQSDTQTTSRVDGTLTAVDSDRASRGLRTTTTPSAPGKLLSPTSGPPTSGSATPGQQLVQVTPPAAPATATSSTPVRPSPGIEVGVTTLVGGETSAGAPTSVTVPSATSTASAPTSPSPTDSARGAPVATQPPSPQPSATQPSATQPSATQPAATKPAATKPAATKPATPEPQATPSTTTPPVAVPPSATKAAATQPSAKPPPAPQPVGTSSPMTAAPATLPVAAPPSATSPVATQPVATQPDATQPVQAPTARPSTGNGASRLHELQSLVTQWLRAEAHQAARPVPPPGSSLSREPSHLSLGLARGPLGPAMGWPRVLPASADLESGPARVAAAPPRHVQSPKPASVGRPRADTPPPISQALSSAPPVQTRLPVGSAAAAGGGGVGSVAPSVLAAFEVALPLATILLVRFSLDLTTRRSTLLGSRLERPG